MLGTGFISLLQVLFVGLKLGGVIDWSWWWVMSPMLISTGLIIGAALTYMLLVIVSEVRK